MDKPGTDIFAEVCEKISRYVEVARSENSAECLRDLEKAQRAALVFRDNSDRASLLDALDGVEYLYRHALEDFPHLANDGLSFEAVRRDVDVCLRESDRFNYADVTVLKLLAPLMKSASYLAGSVGLGLYLLTHDTPSGATRILLLALDAVAVAASAAIAANLIPQYFQHYTGIRQGLAAKAKIPHLLEQRSRLVREKCATMLALVAAVRATGPFEPSSAK